MHTVDGTTQLCTILLGISSYVQCGWDYSPIYTIAGTTQLHTLLLGLHNNVQFCCHYQTMKDFWANRTIKKCFDYTVMYNASGTTQLRTMFLKLLLHIHAPSWN